MANLGIINHLKINRKVDFGVYLDGQNLGEILMPKRYVSSDMKIGDTVEVIVYLDGEERLVATTEKPHGVVGDYAYLKVNKVDKIGAFCDMGLLKELLVPFSEQRVSMEEGKYYLVYIYIDPVTDRIVGSMKLDKFLDKDTSPLKVNELVDLIVWTQTDIGYKVIIDQQYLGVVYKNEVHQPLSNGQKVKGYVKKVREDGKVDLSLQELGHQKFDKVSEKILYILDKAGGKLPYHDKTDPEVITKIFGISKKTFKQSLGMLYKKREIEITPQGFNRPKK
jgi:uncharacterized protein